MGTSVNSEIWPEQAKDVVTLGLGLGLGLASSFIGVIQLYLYVVIYLANIGSMLTVKYTLESVWFVSSISQNWLHTQQAHLLYYLSRCSFCLDDAPCAYKTN